MFLDCKSYNWILFDFDTLTVKIDQNNNGSTFNLLEKLNFISQRRLAVEYVVKNIIEHINNRF